jgi:hypothetical protein
MKRHVTIALIGSILLGIAWGAPPQELPHMVNSSDKKSWVYRHNKDDKNSRNDSVATVTHLNDAGVVNDVPYIDGDLYFWLKYNPTTKKYEEKHWYKLKKVMVKRSGEKNRKHESVTWELGDVTPKTKGDKAIRVLASLFKGKDKGNSSADRRLVVRFKYPEDRARGSFDDCCDQEPDDDVLQEEDDPGDPPDPDC